jgi:hypothetical protein
MCSTTAAQSRWNEIVLLTAGHLGEFSPYQATRFIRTILEMKSEYEISTPRFAHGGLMPG